MKKKIRRVSLFRKTVLVLVLLALAAFTIYASRWVLSLREPDKLEAFLELVDSLGVGSWFVLLGIQFFQIVVAFVPGGPIQILAGAAFGPVGGTAVCFVGTILATACVYALVHRYGHRVISLFVDEKDILQYKFLRDNARLEMLVIVLFLIPGTPKDALTYLFALTPLKMSRFMLLSTLARLPAVLTSVLVGSNLVQGNWLTVGILFTVITAIGLLGLVMHKRIIGFITLRRPHRRGK